MPSGNIYLRDMSIWQMALLSFRTVATHPGMALIISVVFYTPIDLLFSYLDFGDPKVSWEKQLFVFSAVSQLYSIGYAAFLWAIGQIVEGRTPSLRDIVSSVSGRSLIRIIGTLMCANLVVVWPMLPLGFAIGFVMAWAGSDWLLAALVVACVIVMAVRFATYSLSEFPAVFENTNYFAATKRSRELSKGKRVWLSFAFMSALVLFLALTYLFTEFLPDLVAAKQESLTSIGGVLRILYNSLASSLLRAVLCVFQILLYFRLRRAKHDLSFFDLSDTGSIVPAQRLPEFGR